MSAAIGRLGVQIKVIVCTADILVQIADGFSELGSEMGGAQIDFHALRTLASPSIPQELRDRAVQRAIAGGA